MRIHPIILLGLWTAACTDGPADPDPGGSGELGAGNFTYLCRGEGDFTCPIGQVTAGFPQRFVASGRFGLAYAWKDAQDHINDPLPALQSAAPDHLAYASDTFTATIAGYAAILAVTGNSKVIDIIHADIRAVDDLRLVDAFSLPTVAALGELVMPVTGLAQVQLVPLDQDDVPLAGAVDVAWSLGSDTVVAITAGQTTGRVHLEALTAGEATLTATLGDKIVSVQITVDALLEPTTGPTDTGDTFTTTTLTTSDSGDTTDTGTTDSSTTDSSTTDTSTTDTSGTTADTTGGAL